MYTHIERGNVETDRSTIDRLLDRSMLSGIWEHGKAGLGIERSSQTLIGSMTYLLSFAGARNDSRVFPDRIAAVLDQRGKMAGRSKRPATFTRKG